MVDLSHSHSLFSSPPEIDLNDLLLEHPAASFVFRCGDADYIVVDRAATPSNNSLVLVERDGSFTVDSYHGQPVWGVITRLLRKLS